MSVRSTGWILAALLALAGCAGHSPPADRFYRLEPPPPTAAPVAGAPVLLLSPVQASGIYAERMILHREAAPGSPSVQYNYQFWAEPPALMVGDALGDRLRRAFGDLQVHDRGTRARPGFVIAPRLRRMEQVFDAGQGAGAALALEIVVTDRDGAPSFTIAFDETAPAADRSPEAFVTAMNGLLAKAGDALVARLGQAIGAAQAP